MDPFNRWQFRQQRRMWRQQRRYSRGYYGFPWFLIVIGIILIVSLHQIVGVVFAVFLFVVAALFIRRLFLSNNSWFGSNQNWQQTPYYQPPQQQNSPYYQPSEPQPTQQQNETPYYQPYNQGYQPNMPPYQQESGPKESAPNEYSNYDQPQVRYPEPMPPQEQ